MNRFKSHLGQAVGSSTTSLVFSIFLACNADKKESNCAEDSTLSADCVDQGKSISPPDVQGRNQTTGGVTAQPGGSFPTLPSGDADSDSNSDPSSEAPDDDVERNPPKLENASPVDVFIHEDLPEVRFANAGAAAVTCEVKAYATDGSHDIAIFKLKVIDCPNGYIPVTRYQDAEIDVPRFCVMKYEAKNDGAGRPVSQAEDLPWVDIPRGEMSETEGGAWRACRDLGPGYDLISNLQWQSLARQIETTKDADGLQLNMSTHDGTTRFFNVGNVNNSPAAAAGPDEDPCIGTRSPTYCVDRSTYDFVFKRTHTLHNGEVIWDLGGNVIEWLRDDIDHNYGVGDSTSVIAFITADAGDPCLEPECGDLQGHFKKVFGPLGDYSAFNAFLYGGLGAAFAKSDAGSAIYRGSPGTIPATFAGVFSMAYGASADVRADTLGFRCVYAP